MPQSDIAFSNFKGVRGAANADCQVQGFKNPHVFQKNWAFDKRVYIEAAGKGFVKFTPSNAQIENMVLPSLWEGSQNES